MIDTAELKARLFRPFQPTLNEENLLSFSSKVLSNVFAVTKSLCDEKFELRADNVRFVGHPISLEFAPGEEKNYYR